MKRMRLYAPLGPPHTRRLPVPAAIAAICLSPWHTCCSSPPPTAGTLSHPCSHSNVSNYHTIWGRRLAPRDSVSPGRSGLICARLFLSPCFTVIWHHSSPLLLLLQHRPWMYYKNWIADWQYGGMQNFSSGHWRYCSKKSTCSWQDKWPEMQFIANLSIADFSWSLSWSFSLSK